MSGGKIVPFWDRKGLCTWIWVSSFTAYSIYLQETRYSSFNFQLISPWMSHAQWLVFQSSIDHPVIISLLSDIHRDMARWLTSKLSPCFNLTVIEWVYGKPSRSNRRRRPGRKVNRGNLKVTLVVAAIRRWIWLVDISGCLGLFARHKQMELRFLKAETFPCQLH